MDAKIDIYGISGDVICSVLITKDAVSHEELMTSDYIQLSWNDDKTIVLPAGAYIIYQDEKYSLIEPYLPLRENEAEYKYTPQFHSRIMIWDKIPVPLYTYESDGLTIKSREMDWDFTGSPADAMYMVKQAIKNETGENWTIQLSESLPATITISSQSTSIFSNLNNIAEECETEWWTDKKTNTIYLSECKYGTPLKLIVGENVSVPSVSESKDGYYTRFYAFGSTRNITQEYDSGQATNHIANKRLGLDPTKYPGGFKDIKGHFENGVFTSDLMPGEIFIKTLFFDKIFPSSKLTISDVRARLKYRLDNNGNKIKIGGTDDEPVYEQYAIWYFQIENFNFDKESIIDGKNLSVSFESGQLAGRDFELKYYDKPEKKNDEADVTTFEIKTGDYEIIIDESTGNIIPGLSYIIPQNGDQIILFNIIMPSEYVSSAQNELEKELDKAISDASKDNNSYEVESYPENFYEHSYDTHLGQEVNFYNGDNILNSRILMVEKHLDFQYEQTIRIGNEHIKGNTQELKEEVANVNQNIDIIKAFNELSTSLSNAYANAQREMIEGFAAIKNIWEFDNDESHWSTDNNGDKRKTIKSKYNVWSSGYISALGTNTSEDSSGTGSFDLLQDWDKYVDSTAKSMALSAYLGKDLLDRITSLEKGQKGHKITISGSGNVVVNVEESSDGGTLTFTKGNIDLSGYATKTELEAVSKKTDSVTQRVDEFLGGSDTDGIINKWKELEAFLDGQQQGTTLSSLLDKKVDKTIQVKAGEGLSGGGALSGNVTLSLATVGTAGTYTKVTVDKYGRVTGHATLSASDIPTLEISKINGLQEELDKKLNISDFGNKFATEMANWFKKDTEGNVFVANSKGFYSESFVSAMGKSSGGSSSGGGSYDRLDNWADYSADRATWVLSAKLGYDLNTRVSSLESGSAINFETSGTGNALTGFSKSGNTVTFTKGTFLTEHQKLYTLTMQRNGEGVGSYVPTADKIININACTAINVPQGFTAGALSSVGVIALSFASGYSLPTTAKQQQWDTAYSFVESIAGSDANGVIDKWNEIISFLDGIGDSSTLEGLLNDINSNVTAVSSRVTKLEGYFVNGVAKEAAKTTGTLSINGKNFNGSASVNVGVIGVSYGGTGKSSVASGSMLYASAANTYAELATTEFGRNLLKANSGSVVSGLYAEAAYKLQNKRTIWGQSFDGSANVSGLMTSVYGFSNMASIGDTWSDGTNSHIWYGYDGRYPNTGVYSATISDYFGLSLKTESGNISLTRQGYVGIGTFSPSAKLHIVGDLFINTGDPTLKIYSGMINDTKSDGNICLQTNIDTRDGETQEYPTQYPQRCNLVLQPRGGQVYVGMNPDGGDSRYKLLVNGKIKSVDEVVSTSAFRIAKGNYGVLMRNDGTSYYMLLTNSGQAEAGTWNSLRPFIVDLATGNVDLVQAGEHLSVSGDTQFNKSVSIGNGKIEWDEANKAFKFTGGIYSDSYISAMGLNAAGGSGGSYERLDSWSDYTEDKATWVLSALLGSNLNTRVSALEAGGATSVVTSGTGNVVTAVTKSGNVITATKGITALTSHQNIYALTLQGNGSTIGTFNPKTGNSTINITAANIGAAASSHTHNYLPLTGGTITGELSFKPTDSSDAAPKIYSSTAEGGVTNLNFVVADDSNDSFIFRMNYYKNTNEADRERFIINWYGVTSKAAITAPSFNGNLNGNASTASKLGTSTVGGTAKPIYLNAGTATALSATVGSSSLPVYLNAGTITQCGTSLGVSITGNSATTNQLNASGLTSQSLADYKTSGHLYYAGGSNTVSDKPSGVDAFGMFTMQTASGWQGQILMASNTATSLYWRTANNNFNGGWRKILDSSNYGEYAYSKTDADGRFVNLSGDTMTGALKVPELRFTNGTAIWFDQYGNVTFGSTSSSNWWYIGSSSNSPSIAVNFGTGNVGIGQSASTTYKLAVNGDVHANSFTGSLNGNASTASKWQAARTVTMNGFADCSFSIDGSSNVSFDYKPYNFHLSVNNKINYPWHRIAKVELASASYQDFEAVILLSQAYDKGRCGIIRITLRTNDSASASTAHVDWLSRKGFDRTDVKIGLYNVYGKTYADVFLKITSSYNSVTGVILTQGSRGTLGRTWTLVNSSEVNNTTTTDKLTSTECWTSIEVAAEELHKKAYTNIIEADDAGGVGILYDHGRLTAISGTTMPNEGLRLYRVYNNGYPAAYGNLMSVRGENSGAGELLLEWKGSTELGHIYYRSKRDNTSSGWSSWGTLAFLTDNVASATKLQTARSINGTSFDGTENITTFKWGSSRNIYIRDASQTHTGEAVSVDGSSNEYLLLPKDVAFDQITINTKLISNGQTDFNKQWLKNVGGIWFGSADSSSVFASFDGDGTQTGLQSKAGTSIYFGWRGGTRAMTIDSAGNVVIGNTSTVNSAYKLDVKGDVRTQGDIVPYSNGQYNIGSSGARWNTLFTQSIELYGFTPYIDFHFNNSSADYTSRIVEVVSGCLAINGTLAVLKSGNVGIGTTLPTEKLYVSGNIAATGAVTALVLSSSSDIRLKDIRKNVCLSVEEIAKAPAVEFAWKKTGDLAVGSIAQYWQPILPQAIHKRDNYLSMQYDVIALLASIANARRILSIEKKIKELEEEVKRLKIS